MDYDMKCKDAVKITMYIVEVPVGKKALDNRPTVCHHPGTDVAERPAKTGT